MICVDDKWMGTMVAGVLARKWLLVMVRVLSIRFFPVAHGCCYYAGQYLFSSTCLARRLNIIWQLLIFKKVFRKARIFRYIGLHDAISSI